MLHVDEIIEYGISSTKEYTAEIGQTQTNLNFSLALIFKKKVWKYNGRKDK